LKFEITPWVESFGTAQIMRLCGLPGIVAWLAVAQGH
jgi:hypothetical protein